MAKKYLRLGLIGSIALLSGCASMDQGQCVTAEWLEQGRKDGTQGTQMQHYKEYQSDCSKYGVSVNTAEYKKGWQEGIRQYCTRDNGWAVGIRGGTYRHSCPSNLESTFYSAYQTARNIHTKRSEIDRLSNEIEGLGDKLASSDLTAEKRKELKAKRKDKKSEKSRLQFSLTTLQSEAKKMGFPAANLY